MPVAALTSAGQAQPGLFGKIPSRGDFVRVGLPRGFVQPWDDWLQRVIGGSKAALGARWLPAWMEAPIWRFALPAGMCGESAVIGIWLPSVDRAGRHFPLTLALVLPGEASPDLAAQADWLAQAEQAGLQALSDELSPEVLAARLAPGQGGWMGEQSASSGLPADLAPLAEGRALWWTEGSPFVAAGVRVQAALPEVADFITMLDETSEAPASTNQPVPPDGVEGT